MCLNATSMMDILSLCPLLEPLQKHMVGHEFHKMLESVANLPFCHIPKEIFSQNSTAPSSSWTTDSKQVWSMDSYCWCLILTLPSVCLSSNKDSLNSGHVFPVFNCPVLVSLFPLWLQHSVLGRQKWNLTWSAVVAHPTQGVTCGLVAAFLLARQQQGNYV